MLRSRDPRIQIVPRMANQMDKKMEDESGKMETGSIKAT